MKVCSLAWRARKVMECPRFPDVKVTSGDTLCTVFLWGWKKCLGFIQGMTKTRPDDIVLSGRTLLLLSSVLYFLMYICLRVRVWSSFFLVYFLYFFVFTRIYLGSFIGLIIITRECARGMNFYPWCAAIMWPSCVHRPRVLFFFILFFFILYILFFLKSLMPGAYPSHNRKNRNNSSKISVASRILQ